MNDPTESDWAEMWRRLRAAEDKIAKLERLEVQNSDGSSGVVVITDENATIKIGTQL